MESICELCSLNINEDHVCRDCRIVFEPLNIDTCEFHMCLECEDCDKYNFPCKNCAKTVFDYILGAGNGPNNGDGDEYPILNFDEMVDIIYQYEHIEIQDSVLETESETGVTTETVTEDVSTNETETIESNSSYCTLQ